MSDRFDELFEDLRGQPAPAPFASASEVRARGRQRGQRRAVGLVAAAVLLAGGGAGWAVTATGQPDSPPVASGPASASPTPEPEPGPEPPPEPDLGWRAEVTPRWLLTPDDLPDEGWELVGHELFEDEPAWFWTGCADPAAILRPDLFDQRRDLATVSWSVGEAAPSRIDQIVDLFDGPTAARANFADVTVAAGICSDPANRAAGTAPLEYEVIDGDFAGYESVLYRELAYAFDEEGGWVPVELDRFVAVARVGPAVTTVIGLDERLTREAVLQAVDRLSEMIPLPGYADPPGAEEQVDEE